MEDIQTFSEDIQTKRQRLHSSLSTESFQNQYSKYKDDKKDFAITIRKFLNNIETNQNYYKMNVSFKNVKYKKKISDDTHVLKTINSKLNVCSENNVHEIQSDIRKLLVKKKHLIPQIIENIIEKCILQTMYLDLFIMILRDFNDMDYVNDLIDGIVDTLFGDCNQTTPSDKSLYMQLCNKNKLSDNRIGFCECITMFEINGIVKDRVSSIMSRIIDIMNDETDEEKMYPLIVCLYSVAKRNQSYVHPHITYLKELSLSVKYKKLMFKIKDILELY
jgi:hypothetical protein